MIKTPKGDVLHFEQLPHFYSLLKTVLISLLSEHCLIMGRAWPGVAEFTLRGWDRAGIRNRECLLKWGSGLVGAGGLPFRSWETTGTS